MRILVVVSFILVIVSPASLFAQGGNTGGSSTSGSSTGASFSDSTQGVENQAQAGTFVGGGRPDVFVGTVDVYAGSSSASRTAASNSRASAARATTTTRPRTSTAASQRVAGTTTGLASQAGSVNTQTIRALTSFEDRTVFPTVRTPQPTIESYFARIQGIQDRQLTFTSSPTGTTAVISGTVSSNTERRVAQQMLLLEPGIDRVDNRLEVR